MNGSPEHQKKPAATDQKFRTDDEHIHELDKRHLTESKKDAALIPKPKGKPDRKKKD